MSEQNSNVAQKEPSPSRRSYDFSRELRIASRSEASTQRVAVRFKERYQKKTPVPPARRMNWNDQMYQTRVFNELVYNTDPNLGNILITEGWNIRLIDFTRAFRTLKTLRTPKNLKRCDRRIYNAMQELNGENLTRELGKYLTKSEIRGMLARRDKIMKFFNSEIAAKGEAAVICDKEGH